MGDGYCRHCVVEDQAIPVEEDFLLTLLCHLDQDVLARLQESLREEIHGGCDNSLFEVSHWFDQCDLPSFKRSGSRVLLEWLDEPTQGEPHVANLSEPGAFALGLQVSRGVRAQTTAQTALWAHSPSTRADLS